VDQSKGLWRFGPLILYWGAQMEVIDGTVYVLYGIALAFGRLRIPVRISVLEA
jgi:hypothetical protein